MTLYNLRLWFTSLLVLSAALPVYADTQFRARKMTRTDVPLGKGQCDIRLQVDNEVEVTVRGDMVFARTISGRDSRDDGSECNEPLPVRDIQGFNFEVKDSRGEIRLLAEPSRRNGFGAVVRIRDSAGGEGRYHFRLSWMITGGGDFTRRGPDDFRRDGDDSPARRRNDDLDDRRGGLAWNNTTHFAGRGQGSSTLSGYGGQRLMDVSVDIDRGNRIFVSFRTDSGRALAFSGQVIGIDGDTIKADVATDDRARLRGSMYLSRNPRGDVYRITLDATDGQDRLSLDWSRR
ncbi:MAG TPA: hypothetical protein VKT49_02495 [Bryobacteraceae bacterium]|nr:hypothetical protein [Bryobacteraceae bacterium]